jgi:pyridoxine kinase
VDSGTVRGGPASVARGVAGRCAIFLAMVNVLSIQSHVAYGHAGNASAVFPLQRLGVEVWPVHTVQFSNHTGYGAWTGRVFDGQAVEEVVQGIDDRGVLGRCDAVLSGYLGSADIGHAVVGTVARVRAANPDAVFCCDPVIGDVGRGVFVRPGIEEFMRDVAVPAADVVTPNHFELDLLSGTPTTSLDAVKDAVATVQGLGPRVVLTTSLVTDDTPDDSVDLLASEGGRHFRVRTPRLDVSVNGAGDAIAALFLAHWLDTRSAGEALGRAAASVFGLLQRTEDAGSREILLVEAQEEFVSPTRTFAVDEV